MIRSRFLVGAVALVAIGVAGCQPIKTNRLSDRVLPSNDRDWAPQFALVPHAEIGDQEITIHNIRHCDYLTNEDYVVGYYDRTIRLSDVRSLDFVVSPFPNAPALAHTFLSFEVGDGEYICVSVEVRKEKGEAYSPLLGISNQFELMYVVANEKDLIRVRTRHRGADVYVYPTVATPEQARELLIDVLRRVNHLAANPEFYNTLSNNCTTNLADHVNGLKPGAVKYGWQVLLPGLSDQYAYDLGLLDTSIPFEQLKAMARVNELAEQYYDAPDFSSKIRLGRSRLARYQALDAKREASPAHSGDEYLRHNRPTSPTRRLWR